MEDQIIDQSAVSFVYTPRILYIGERATVHDGVCVIPVNKSEIYVLTGFSCLSFTKTSHSMANEIFKRTKFESLQLLNEVR